MTLVPFDFLLCDAGHRCQDLAKLAAAGQLGVGRSPQACPSHMLDRSASRAGGDAAYSSASLGVTDQLTITRLEQGAAILQAHVDAL